MAMLMVFVVMVVLAAMMLMMVVLRRTVMLLMIEAMAFTLGMTSMVVISGRMVLHTRMACCWQ